jgi:uncharacterized damage-inducible protein DinB
MEDPVRRQYLQDCAETFRTYKAMADASLSRVTDEQFFETIDVAANSLAVLVKHMAGNLRSRWTDLLDSDGEKPDRDRDAEFEITASDTRAVLLDAWEEGWSRALGSLESLTPSDLERTVHVRTEPLTLPQALNRQMTHAAYHVGQIVLLAKHHQAAAWESLSIPRGRSRQFNAAMSVRPRA